MIAVALVTAIGPLPRRLCTMFHAGVLAGSTLLGAAVVNPDTASAQEAPSGETREERLAERQQRIEERIAQAIESEHITEAEADELRARIEERRAQGEERRSQRQADRQVNRQARLDDLASQLGTNAEDLKAALKDGQSIADIAAANGVDLQGIIDSMVDQANARIDEAVANERIDADKAAELKANVEERITARLNGERRSRG